MVVALKGKDEEKLHYLNSAMMASWSSGKPTYAKWLRFFYEEGQLELVCHPDIFGILVVLVPLVEIGSTHMSSSWRFCLIRERS